MLNPAEVFILRKENAALKTAHTKLKLYIKKNPQDLKIPSKGKTLGGQSGH